jgi:tetratricopeptide (TPR) repeat protein
MPPNRHPGREKALFDRGVALKGQGKLAEAVAAFRDAIRIEPDRGESHIGLGMALYLQGKPDDPTADCDEHGEQLHGQSPEGSGLGLANRCRAHVASSLEATFPAKATAWPAGR